ncbi:MAG: 3-isopropylmalate dehydratase small subunit, partial [Paludibacteraceae bacterium]|nr:3-isopropylmalate dehydratase small subunit [Paludibacteraceae bacterium]
MKKLEILTSRVIPLPIDNIDTDQIVPARYLKATTRDGFGEYLFRDWRFAADGTPKKEFVLNNPAYQGTVLLAGKNFGSGSSREHAAWAVAGYGFRVVVSTFFADIFRNNAMNNGVLPVVVPEAFSRELEQTDWRHPAHTVTIDLPRQIIRNDATGSEAYFDINPFKKECFLQGYD